MGTSQNFKFPNKYKVLGIDLALTRTGLVLLDGSDIVTSTLVTTRAEDAWLKRIEMILQNVMALIKDADLVTLENYAFGSKFSREALGELGGVMKREILLTNTPVLLVSPLQMKQFATGSGKTPPCPKGEPAYSWTKKWFQKKVLTNFGKAFASSDETDAYVLALIGQAYLNARREGEGFLENLLPHQITLLNKLIKGDKKNGRKNRS